MFPSTSPRKAFLACPPSPPWNLPSPTVESTLSSPCSSSDLPLSRQDAALAHLDSLPPHDLVLYIDGSVPFPFGNAAIGNFCWYRQRQQLCHFSSLLLLCDSRSVLAILSSTPTFLLPQTLWQIWQELPSISSCSIRLQWVPGHLFLPGDDAADELARRGALLAPSAISCSLSPLISCIHPCHFSDWRRTVSSKFFYIQVPSISTEEHVLPRHARCVLSNLSCNGHRFLLGSYLSRIGRILPAAHVDTRPRTLLISFCTIQLRTLCAARSLATLRLSTNSGQGTGELPGFWGSMVFRHAQIHGKGRITTTTTTTSCLIPEIKNRISFLSCRAFYKRDFI